MLSIRFVIVFLRSAVGRQLEVEFHFEHSKQAVHDLHCDVLYIQLRHKGKHLLLILFGHLIHPHCRRKKAAEFMIRRKVNVAFPCHIVSHQPRSADLHFIKIAVGIVGEIRAENLFQLGCGMQIDIFRRRRQRVCLGIQLPEIFVQLGKCQLYRSLHRIGIDRRLISHNAPCRAELPAEHGLHQFQQNFILGRKQVQITSSCNARLFDDLSDRGIFISLLQKSRTHTVNIFRLVSLLSLRK